jgi:tetratricopeptide (TPR) repeat protein
MFKFFKTDPSKKAKKCVEKALIEIEEGYPDYASIEFEKAARLFLEEEQIDFAVKYFREAAYTALETNDHSRCAEMKIAAAECLFIEGRYDEGGGLYSESSDHLYRDKKLRNSNRALGVAIIGYLGARNFDTATNLMRKAEKRLDELSGKTDPMYELAKLCVLTLCEGADVSKDAFEKAAKNAKPSIPEQPLLEFVVGSVRLAINTMITLSWAGPEQHEVPVKCPIELELQFKCPTEVRVVDSRVSLSNSVVVKKAPEFRTNSSKDESWLIEFLPVLSGSGTIGPYTMTLEGEKVLVHKHSNKIEFTIARAPSDLELNVIPERVSCTLGDEAIIEVNLKNIGDGPADNISIKANLSEGLEISLGNEEKNINFLGSGETIHFQIFVRAISQGDELVTINAIDSRSGKEVVKTAMVRVG